MSLKVNDSKFHIPLFPGNRECWLCGHITKLGFAQRSHAIGHVNRGEAVRQNEGSRYFREIISVPPRKAA